MSRRFGIWWPVAAWAGLILGLTTIQLPGVATMIGGSTDKVGHFLLYGVLGWLVAGALYRGGAGSRSLAFLALAVCTAFAGLDEAHQVLLPGRVPDLIDWAVDVAGLVAGMAVYRVTIGRGARALRNTEGSGADPRVPERDREREL